MRLLQPLYNLCTGVEAQTITVWRQAGGYRVPRVLYLNKMDRRDADAAACARAVEDKLLAPPLLVHRPLRHEGKLIGNTIHVVYCYIIALPTLLR